MTASVSQLIAQSWTIPFWPTIGTLITALVYVRGWRVARLTRPRELPAWRAACFLTGLLTVWLALASPVDALDNFLLVAHMTQHLLLMSLAPPLLILGCPVVPLLRGLPRSFVRDELAPWMNSRAFRFLQKLFTHPAFGWLAMTAAIVFWHMPAAYELALRSAFWHDAEHACFFFAALAFWWFTIRPWPSHIRFTRWMIVPYVVTAHLVMLTVATIIALADWVIYPSYAHVPRLFGMGVLTDQGLAGGEMVFVGLLAVLATLYPLIVELVSEAEDQPQRSKQVFSRAQAFLPVRRRNKRGRLPLIAPALSIVCLVAISAAAVQGFHSFGANDEGRMLFRQPAGPFVVSVFTAPDPLTSGDAAFSVAVERPNAGGLIENANVELVLTPSDGGNPITVHADHRDGDARFLQAAEVTLPESGTWHVTAVVRRGSETGKCSGEVRALPAETAGQRLAWNLAWLPLAALLFYLHQRRKRKYRRSRQPRLTLAPQVNPATAR